MQWELESAGNETLQLEFEIHPSNLLFLYQDATFAFYLLAKKIQMEIVGSEDFIRSKQEFSSSVGPLQHLISSEDT